MRGKYILVLFLLFGILWVSRGTEGLEQVLTKCCNLGVRWSWDNNTCNEYSTPIKGIAQENQGICLSTIDACCRKNYRDLQCTAGRLAAKAGEECKPGVGVGATYHKDCCEGCKLGLVAGTMGLDCEFHSLKLALGPPWDASLTKCCLQSGGKMGLPTTPKPQPSYYTTPNYRYSTTFRPVQGDICQQFNGELCSHNCINEGYSYKCSCREGFHLLPDEKSCQTDPDTYTSSSTPETGKRSSSSSSLGQCPMGFVYNPSSGACDDVDECLSEIGNRACYPYYKSCRNTVGSFICEEAVTTTGTQCPPGYRMDDSTGDCIDIDECQLRVDICLREIQYCINTPGGFDCQRIKDFQKYNCPAGYKFNNVTLNCDDVNECTEGLDSCERSVEVCRNTAGAYECDAQCQEGYRFETRKRACNDVDECKEGTHECQAGREQCVNILGSYQCHQLHVEDSNCPPGFEPDSRFGFMCQDRDECSSGLHTCGSDETCINEQGGYRCDVNAPIIHSTTTDNEIGEGYLSYETTSKSPRSASTLSLKSGGQPNTYFKDREVDLALSGTGASTNHYNPSTTERTSNSIRQPTLCPTGFKADGPNNNTTCVDVNECEQNLCDSNQVCQNTPGSFYCHCRSGYYRDPITRSCQVNECLTQQHNCLPSQRCDNSPGSFHCIRITGCGTGYTLNSKTGQCDDDDECLFEKSDCSRLGPDYQCKNTPGSFKCEKITKNCPTGLILAPSGECRPPCSAGYQFNSRGDCTDIDECAVYGRSLCTFHQQCVNSLGSYKCMSKIICPAGYEPDSAGKKCVDKDECADGSHTCRHITDCSNRGGGYICKCPPGHGLTSSGDCEDIDECVRYNGQVCGSNADCHNSIGSFYCICKEGFEHGADNRTCNDVNECATITGLCEQDCHNTWGSYKCSCGNGYTLGEEGRSCRDIDECAEPEGKYLCIGHCVNSPGSYLCQCPHGYKLGSDGRVCQDIDECLQPQACRQDEQCLNTRGGFRCNRIQCPAGYSRDGDQNECKKTIPCRSGDQQCLREPLTYSKNFISFTSNIRIPAIGYVDMFTMKGPSWPGAVMHFGLDVKNTRTTSTMPVAGRNHFLLRRPSPHQAVIALAKPIEGPQDVQLELKMEVFHRGSFAGSAVAQILIVVTNYEF